MNSPRTPILRFDSDIHKGAVEDDQSIDNAGGPSLQGQLDHRSSDPDVKDADTDFPEPGNTPAHSGQHE